MQEPAALSSSAAKMVSSNGAVEERCDGMGSECQKAKIFAEEFVERLLDEGCKSPCDDTSRSFGQYGSVPPFYDEEKFRRLVGV